MVESYLITIDDVSAVRKISQQINEIDFNSRVVDIQRRNLLNLLGNAMYTDLMNNVSEDMYTELISGKEYVDSNNETVSYFGLKSFLSWHVIARLLADGNIKYSDLGNTQASGGDFSLTNTEDSAAARKEAFANATNFQNNIIAFLDAMLAVPLRHIREKH